ncbi:hypothetical protein C362_01446 [Cryptococcus neoformans Bt1]|nr:hypothetical protein C362_01446 [Cryptococcus neoformans var. grubii Bt1]
MILPEDTKAPIPSDDGFDDDFASLPPSPFLPSRLLPGQDANQQHPFEYLASPTSVVTQRLFLSEEDDIELGPAPPYAPNDPLEPQLQRRNDRKGYLHGKVGKRFMLGIVWGMGLWVGMMGMGALGWRFLGPGSQPRHRGPRQPQSVFLEAPPAEDPWLRQPIECVSFSSTGWALFNSSDLVDHSDSLEHNKKEQRSLNATFYLPLDSEVFVEMWQGPAAIGPVIFSSYDAHSEEEWKGIDDQGSIVALAGHGRKPGPGEYVRVVVETIIDVESGAGDELDGQNSAGWEMLAASSVCLNRRGPTNNITLSEEDLEGTIGDGSQNEEPSPFIWDRPTKNGFGVEIVTNNPLESLYPDRKGNPLQFRVHIALPSLVTQEHKHGIAPSSSFVRSLDVRAGNSAIYVDGLKDVRIGELSLFSEFGEITLQKLRLENLMVRTTGKIVGEIAVSNDMTIDTPIGEIHLNISLATPPRFNLINRPASESVHQIESDVLQLLTPGPPAIMNTLPPVNVNVRSGSDRVIVHYSDWEIPCRDLRMNVFSLIGDVQIFPHPFFQGPFRLITSKGPINVDLGNALIPDPQGLGRWRNITLEERDRMGSRFYLGNVAWQAESVPDHLDRSTEEVISANLPVDGQSIVDREMYPSFPQDHGPRPDSKTERGIHVRTSVGAINVTF